MIYSDIRFRISGTWLIENSVAHYAYNIGEVGDYGYVLLLYGRSSVPQNSYGVSIGGIQTLHPSCTADIVVRAPQQYLQQLQ